MQGPRLGIIIGPSPAPEVDIIGILMGPFQRSLSIRWSKVWSQVYRHNGSMEKGY